MPETAREAVLEIEFREGTRSVPVLLAPPG